MHKYFEMKPPKIKATEQEGELNSDGEDPELAAFADRAIENKMKELQRGSGMVEDDDEDLSIEYSDQDQDEDVEDESGDEMFGGEGLSDVDLGDG